MSFLTNAQETLSAEELDLLKQLQAKSSNFEATPAEEKQLYELKEQVVKAVANRDKMKNLSIIGNKVYGLDEILSASGYSDDEIKKHFNNKYKKAVEKEAVDFAVYTDGNTTFTLNTDQRILKEQKAMIAKAGVKGFITSVTDKDWLMKESTITRGPSVGQKTYPNLKLVATKTGLDYEKLLKELQAKKEPAAKPA